MNLKTRVVHLSPVDEEATRNGSLIPTICGQEISGSPVNGTASENDRNCYACQIQKNEVSWRTPVRAMEPI